MKLHDLVSVAILLCLTTTSYATRGLNYTHDYFRSQRCDYAGCWFEVITSEDSGGLRCRTKPSLRRASQVVEIVPKGEQILALTLVVGEKKRAFFRVFRYGDYTCYMRATQNRLLFIGKKVSNYLKSKEKVIEYIDLIELFSLPLNADYTFNSWETGANLQAIEWLHGGVKWDKNGATRSGQAIVTINGKPLQLLGKRLEPIKWYIKMYGVRGGAYKVEIGTDYILYELGNVLLDSFKKKNYTYKKIQCGESVYGSYNQTVYKYNSDTVKGWVYLEVSCGSAGCSETVTILYNEPKDGSLEKDISSSNCKN